jgi:TRAP-type C4-dicarboxylate transport system permease small subunit
VSSDRSPPLPGWVAAVHAVSRVFGVAAAGLILLSVGIVCQMVFVRAVLGQSSI